MRAEAALRENESRLRAALDVAELGTWTWDPLDATGTSTIAQRRSSACPRVSVANVADAQRARVHPDDLARLQAESAAGIKTGEPFATAYRAIHPDGSIHHVVARGRALLDAAGTPVRIVGTNRDVTVEREAELRLRTTEDRLRTLIRSIRDYAIIMLDPTGTSPSGRRARRR